MVVREIAVSELTENLAQMCIKANHVLSGTRTGARNA